MNYSVTEKNTTKFQNRQFVDLDLNFKRNPITNDVVSKKGQNAIKQSIKNLVLTRIGEKLFNPIVGSYVYNLLFDNIVPETTIALQTSIEDVINTYEPRAIVNQVMVDPDSNNNGYLITLIVSFVNSPEPTAVEFFLERLR
tara:strand:+ start:6216 stop:6638 length:423 start_codon:yes stop_codon:yes gene_type:complete